MPVRASSRPRNALAPAKKRAGAALAVAGLAIGPVGAHRTAGAAVVDIRVGVDTTILATHRRGSAFAAARDANLVRLADIVTEPAVGLVTENTAIVAQNVVGGAPATASRTERRGGARRAAAAAVLSVRSSVHTAAGTINERGKTFTLPGLADFVALADIAAQAAVGFITKRVRADAVATSIEAIAAGRAKPTVTLVQGGVVSP